MSSGKRKEGAKRFKDWFERWEAHIKGEKYKKKKEVGEEQCQEKRLLGLLLMYCKKCEHERVVSESKPHFCLSCGSYAVRIEK